MTLSGELDISGAQTIADAAHQMLHQLTGRSASLNTPSQLHIGGRPGRLAPVGGPGVVVIDVGDLRFIDAAGLGSLVQLRNDFALVGLDVTVMRPSPMLRRLCDICELGAVLRLSPDMIGPTS